MEKDAFIAYASEDKKNVVEPLFRELTKYGLNIWFDKFELKIGSSISREIDKGLVSSEYGIVVLSRDFFRNNWPQRELQGLITKQISTGKVVILPVWHNITKEEIIKISPTLADTFAVKTEIGIDKVALEILKVVKPNIYSLLTTVKIGLPPLLTRSKVQVVPISKLSIGPIRHIVLPNSYINRTKLFLNALKDAYTIDLKEAIELYKRDIHPEREIEIWEKMASIYLDYSKTKILSTDQKRDLFQILLMSSVGPLTTELFKKTKYFSRDEIVKINKSWLSN